MKAREETCTDRHTRGWVGVGGGYNRRRRYSESTSISLIRLNYNNIISNMCYVM